MAKQAKSIIIFTGSYPYTGAREQTFIQDELQIIGEYFDRVFLVPQKMDGELLKIPDFAELDESLALRLNAISISDVLKAIFSPLFYREVLKGPYNFNLFCMITGAYSRAKLTEEWLIRFIKKNCLDSGSVICYSFWMDSSTVGALFAKESIPGIKVVSRCHNADLYGNEDNYYRVAFQRYAVPLLDLNIPDSEAGTGFIRKNIPGAKCETGIMGIKDPGFITNPSSDNVFRIASCAYMIPRKRIGLFLDGLKIASEKMPDKQLIWYHIGDGPLQESIIRKAESVLPANCQFKFMGILSPEELMLFYKENAIDLFVNTSIKEGTPVSLMEAISCGIPLLATAVGGNKEILDYGAGYALKENPSEGEIAEELINIVTQNRDNLVKIRQKCREIWKSHYNSTNNYNEFCDKLINLLSQ